MNRREFVASLSLMTAGIALWKSEKIKKEILIVNHERDVIGAAQIYSIKNNKLQVGRLRLNNFAIGGFHGTFRKLIHPHAQRYPISFLYVENDEVVKSVNNCWLNQNIGSSYKVESFHILEDSYWDFESTT